VLPLMAMALAAAASTARAEDAAQADPLAGLEADDSGAGWAGIHLGMSLVQAERRFSVALALREVDDTRCGRFVAIAERGGLALTAGFPSARPGAKIETLFVRFEGYQVLASGAELVASLKAKVPSARYLPDSDLPDRPEADDPAPVYELPGKTPAAVQIRPKDGLLFASLPCLR
jgi:hypothetical protein